MREGKAQLELPTWAWRPRPLGLLHPDVMRISASTSGASFSSKRYYGSTMIAQKMNIRVITMQRARFRETTNVIPSFMQDLPHDEARSTSKERRSTGR